MGDLKKLRQQYTKKHKQFILIDTNGNVIVSDDTLFECNTNTQLSDYHPFFLALDFSDPGSIPNFNCIHLNIASKKMICDISHHEHKNQSLLIITDFTLHYNSLQSLAQSRNETSISSENIVIDNQAMLKKEVLKNQFIANFNHEMAHPILSLLTFTDMMRKTKLTNEQYGYLDIISSSGQTLKNMINDIFDISKIETGNLHINRKRFSLKRLITQLTNNFSERLLLKGLSIHIDYHKEMPFYIVDDKLRIKQILTNLLDNAIKYSQDGHIEISIEPIYRRARKITFSIAVKDQGTGIDRTKHDFIFGRFNRVKTDYPQPGSGLGLPVVKELLELMRGNIKVESSIGEGSTFTVTLRSTTPLNSPNKTEISTVSQGTQEKSEILIVANRQSDQLNLFKILASTKNYFIDLALNGSEAKALTKKKAYDIILINHNSSSLDALDACKNINEHQKKHTPILVLSALKIDEKLLERYSIYFNAVIYKPFDSETLIQQVNSHIK